MNIKKENLKDKSYYFGASLNTQIARWNKISGVFEYIDDGAVVKTLPYIDDTEGSHSRAFSPRCEVVSLYVCYRNLITIVKKCSVSKWDGKNAKPVTMGVVSRVLSFLEQVATCYIMPTLGAEVDGSISLEWINEGEKYTINIGEGYVAKATHKNSVGKINFESKFSLDSIPEIILVNIEKLV